MAEVTKVKRLNNETTVLWTEPNGQHETLCSLEKCPDTPKKEFLDALATVEADLVARAKGCVTFKAAKAGEGKASKHFTLTGISMTRNAAGRRQFNPSAKADFGWGETGVTLPLLLEPDSENPSSAGNVLSEKELENIEQLFEQGLEYAQGEREQAELELQEGETGTDPFDPAAAAEAEVEHGELVGAGAH